MFYPGSSIYVIDISSKNTRNTSRNACKVFSEFLNGRNLKRMVPCTVVFFLLRDAFYAT